MKSAPFRSGQDRGADEGDRHSMQQE